MPQAHARDKIRSTHETTLARSGVADGSMVAASPTQGAAGFSLDELPQLVNLFLGDMSLVGPRPALPYEVECYEEWHKRRLQAVPGLTGWWQVKGRCRVSFNEGVRMDIYYIEHMSFAPDLKIILLTPWAMISGKGAG
jgi:lipopolysaccharide/colanic/teichoic acid biosynthesis glycosyltransferase